MEIHHTSPERLAELMQDPSATIALHAAEIAAVLAESSPEQRDELVGELQVELASAEVIVADVAATDAKSRKGMFTNRTREQVISVTPLLRKRQIRKTLGKHATKPITKW